jgi:hypothetical protein
MAANAVVAGPNVIPISTVPTLRIVTATFQPSTSYTTGGEVVTAAQFGLSSIAFGFANISTATAAIATGASVVGGASPTIKLYLAGAEATNATDYSAIRVQVVLFGV